jgi:hypothetical protein
MPPSVRRRPFFTPTFIPGQHPLDPNPNNFFGLSPNTLKPYDIAPEPDSPFNPMNTPMQPATPTVAAQVAGQVRRSQSARNPLLRYEDIAPRLEELPSAPQFQPKGKYGVWDRIKAALAGMGMMAARGGQQGGLAAIGGLIGGAIHPQGIERLYYGQYALPQHQAETRAAIERNNMRLAGFDRELKARELIEKINAASRPEYQQLSGLEQGMILDKKSGQIVPVTDEQGEPILAASTRNQYLENAFRQRLEKLKHQWERDRDDAKFEFELKKLLQQHQQAKALQAQRDAAALQRTNIQQRGATGRTAMGIKGAMDRARYTQGEINRRAAMGYGSEDSDEDESPVFLPRSPRPFGVNESGFSLPRPFSRSR